MDDLLCNELICLVLLAEWREQTMKNNRVFGLGKCKSKLYTAYLNNMKMSEG